MSLARTALACLLFALSTPVAGSASPARTPRSFRSLPVTVVTDPTFRALPQWRGKAVGTVEEASADLLDLIDLNLHVTGFAEWTPDASTTTFTGILEALEIAMENDTSLVVLFMGARPAGDEDYLGYASLGSPFLVLAAAGDREMQMTFRHELGHVFGLPHLPGRNAMAERFELRTWEFDPLSLDVLRANRGMDLHSRTPFLNCDLELLRDAYLAWQDTGAGNATLWLNLGIAFRREGRPRDARIPLEAALRLDRTLAPAWYHLGLVRDALSDRPGAVAALERCLDLDPEGRHAADAHRELDRMGVPATQDPGGRPR